MISLVACDSIAQDGKTPYIQDGYWYIDDVNTGVKAEGSNGSDGAVPYIGENYNWFINGIDTGFPSRGANGQSSTIFINEDKYWVIDGFVTEYQAEGNIDTLKKMLESVFQLEHDQFITSTETLTNPRWNYTTSTFSGWGGSIGKPENVEAISVKIRAREHDITQIKFHLNINDKNGDSIISETLDVNIPAKEEQEIIWVLSTPLVNNTDFLYFSYNCNQLCDIYSNFDSTSIIPNDEYQAIMTYATNGSLLNSASQMIDVSSKPCRYIYVKIGTIQDVFLPKDSIFKEKEQINVFLADQYDIAVNDNFQLFYRGVIQAVNPYNYNINVTCSKGSAFPRYFEWMPTQSDIGSHFLKLTITDNNGNLLGSDETTLVVHSPSEANEKKNILCIGDSLTAGGQWVAEAYRRFSKNDGNPVGLGLDFLNFIGTCEREIDGNTVKYEGYGGWTWERYCSSASPFYDSTLNDISFKSYCEKHNFADIDIVYILLTWNGQGTPFKNDYDIETGHFLYAKKIIDKIHEEYPDAIIRCIGIQMPSQNGGMGDNYGASGGYSDDYGMLVTAMNYNAALEDFCQSAQYQDFVKYVDLAAQFDTEYNMPSSEKNVNNRNDKTETIGTNGVHPTTSGYYQIADAVFRSLCEVFSKQ